MFNKNKIQNLSVAEVLWVVLVGGVCMLDSIYKGGSLNVYFVLSLIILPAWYLISVSKRNNPNQLDFIPVLMIYLFVTIIPLLFSMNTSIYDIFFHGSVMKILFSIFLSGFFIFKVLTNCYQMYFGKLNINITTLSFKTYVLMLVGLIIFWSYLFFIKESPATLTEFVTFGLLLGHLFYE